MAPDALSAWVLHSESAIRPIRRGDQNSHRIAKRGEIQIFDAQSKDKCRLISQPDNIQSLFFDPQSVRLANRFREIDERLCQQFSRCLPKRVILVHRRPFPRLSRAFTKRPKRGTYQHTGMLTRRVDHRKYRVASTLNGTSGAERRTLSPMWVPGIVPSTIPDIRYPHANLSAGAVFPPKPPILCAKLAALHTLTANLYRNQPSRCRRGGLSVRFTPIP